MNHNFATVFSDLKFGILNYQYWTRFGFVEVKKRYRRTVIGPFWATLSLGIWVLATGIVGSSIFNQDIRTYLPYLIAGMLPWTMISSIISESCSIFISNENLIKQMKVSYTSFASVIIFRNFILFLHNSIIYFVIFFWSGKLFSINFLFIIPGLLILFLNLFWISIVVGIFCTRYRDLTQVVNSFLQIILFVTPIFFTVNNLKGHLLTFTNLNFIYHLINLVRLPLLNQPPDFFGYVYCLLSLFIGFVLLILLFLMYRKKIPFWL